MTLEHQALLGALGGLLPDILRIVKSRHDPQLQPYLNSVMFWVGLLLAVAVGALAAALAEAANVREALAYGFGAPEVLTRILSTAGRPTTAAGAPEGASALARSGRPTLGNWWAA